MKRIANIFSISLKSDHENSSENTETNSDNMDDDSSTIQMRPDCLNYLQSFQILNKFIMKMLYFPREERKDMTDSYNGSRTHSRKDLIQSFESWIKDLFVISCSAEITDLNKSNSTATPNSKLFEFQSITINTILELIHLSESVNLKYKETLVDSLKKLSIISFNTPDTKINKNVCFMQTVFNVNQIELIFNGSNIGKKNFAYNSNGYK